ncbi:MAG: endo-1,4-beta-xylanase [Lachnospiraceae bacterium]|nr:endo-1,4-beta-xylanase [Lachnospiraceae bacterium]
MKKRKSRKMCVYMLIVSLMSGILSGNVGMETAQAAAKTEKLSAKKITVQKGKSKKVKIKRIAKTPSKVKWKIKNKKIASVKKSGKYAVKVKGKKKGNTVLTCKIQYKGRKAKTLKCKVKVKKAGKNSSGSEDEKNQSNTPAPGGTTPTPNTGNGTDTPTPGTGGNTPTPTPGTGGDTPTPTPGTGGNTPTPTPGTGGGTPTPTPGTFTPVVYKTASFETGTDGFAGRGSATLRSVSGGYSGNALSVTGRGDNWHGASLDVTADIVRGATYKFTAWVKQNTGSAQTIKLTAQLNTGSESYPGIAEVSCKSGEWIYLEGTYEVPLSFNSLAFYFEGAGGTYDFMVDEVVITQITEGQEAIDPMELGSLKDAYSDVFPYFGTCLNCNATWRADGKFLQDPTIMSFVQKQFNSFTLENEMKPDAIMGSSVTKLTKAQAEAKGYVIPSNYTESDIPQLNLNTIDLSLQKAKEYGIKMRAHTLLWHQQTATWFFKEGYSSDGAVVSKEVMDARLEFYVKSVMKHVMEKEKELTGKVGSLVYCWDVTNEYVNHTNDPQSPSWVDVYGEMGLEPTYVKKAYECAYAMLKEYGVEKDVTLFYNDYNTYYNKEKVISLVNYINKGEEAKICGGIGMQSHVDVSRPTLEQYGAAVDAFLATGLEVQITELDVTINFVESGQDNDDQAAYFGDLMKMLVEKQKNLDTSKNSKGITGVTIWGLYDTVSWRASYAPLLFGSGINDPKPSFYAVLEAAGK